MKALYFTSRCAVTSRSQDFPYFFDELKKIENDMGGIGFTRLTTFDRLEEVSFQLSSVSKGFSNVEVEKNTVVLC